MAGKIDVAQLKDRVQPRFILVINVEEFETWLRDNYPDEAAVVFEDWIDAVRDSTEMSNRAANLQDLYLHTTPDNIITIDLPLR